MRHDLSGAAKNAEAAAIAGEPFALQALAALLEVIGRPEATAARAQAGDAARLRPVVSAFEPAVGSTAWVVVPAATVRREPAATAVAETVIPANTKLPVLEVVDGWVKVEWPRLRPGEHVLTLTDASVRIAPASVERVSGWVSGGELGPSSLDPAALRDAGSRGLASERIRALELLVAVSPEDAGARRALGQMAFDAGLVTQAVEAMAPLDRKLQRTAGGEDVEGAIEYLHGCSGDAARAVNLGDLGGPAASNVDAWEQRIGVAPFDACVGVVHVEPPCDADAERAEASARARLAKILAKTFPSGPRLRISLRNHGPGELFAGAVRLAKVNVGPQTCDGFALEQAGATSFAIPSVPPRGAAILLLELGGPASSRWTLSARGRVLGWAQGPGSVDCSVTCGHDSAEVE